MLSRLARGSVVTCPASGSGTSLHGGHLVHMETHLASSRPLGQAFPSLPGLRPFISRALPAPPSELPLSPQLTLPLLLPQKHIYNTDDLLLKTHTYNNHLLPPTCL